MTSWREFVKTLTVAGVLCGLLGVSGPVRGQA